MNAVCRGSALNQSRWRASALAVRLVRRVIAVNSREIGADNRDLWRPCFGYRISRETIREAEFQRTKEGGDVPFRFSSVTYLRKEYGPATRPAG